MRKTYEKNIFYSSWIVFICFGITGGSIAHAPHNYIIITTVTPRKDADTIQAGLTPELREYEELYELLKYQELDFLPSVFGRYGGFSTSCIPEKSDRILRGCTKNNLVPPSLDNE